jgi:hypothetical protein
LVVWIVTQSLLPEATAWKKFPGLDVERGSGDTLRMKQVFSSPDSAQVGLAQSVLDAAGIACEVRNDAVSQAVPGMPFSAELWVLRDEDCGEAQRLVLSVGSGHAGTPE